MTAAKTTSNAQVGTRLSVVEYKVDELKKGQDRIENKLDLINYVPLTTYHNDQEANDVKFATKKDIEPLNDLIKAGRRVLWAIITVFAVAVGTFIVSGGLTR